MCIERSFLYCTGAPSILRTVFLSGVQRDTIFCFRRYRAAETQQIDCSIYLLLILILMVPRNLRYI